MCVIGSGGLIVVSAVAEAVLSLLVMQPNDVRVLSGIDCGNVLLVYVVFACVVFW